MLLLVAQVAAAAPVTDRQALAAEVVKLSGLEQVAAQFPTHVRTQGESRKQGSPNAALEEKVIRAMVSAFDAARANQLLLEHFAKQGDKATLSRARDWLAAPQGARITREELAANQAGQAELKKFDALMKNSPPTPQRMRLVRDIESAARMTALNVEMLRETLAALALGVNAQAPVAKRVPEAQVRQQIDTMLGMARPQIEAQVLTSALFSYRRLNDTDLAEYARFLNADAGRRYSGLSMGATLDALKDYLARAVAATAPAAGAK
jgi:hypothetical protein